MNKLGTDAKASGTKLIVFPEGTRNGSKGLKLLPFKKGAFHVALDAKLPILPVVISEYHFLDTSRMSFQPGNVTIKVLAGLRPQNTARRPWTAWSATPGTPWRGSYRA